ncbi:hypothetical protein N9T41_03720 [Candidatus Pelagibacter sp.]|nr:hypothetical protein [Candidatus Pelagibacter sp.]
MKKILGILVLGLLLIIFSGTAQAKCSLDKMFSDDFKIIKKNGEAYCVKKNLFNRAGDAIDDLNPLNYFEKRKRCQARADLSDNVALGKIHFKHCMKE